MYSEYGNDSIDTLEGAERVRRNPQNLLGSRGLDGAKHTVKEILGNATDEHLAGFGDTLDLKVYKDGAISIRDYGRGVPLGWNTKKEKWNYFLIYEELYAGGKYQNQQEVLREIDAKGLWDTFNFKDYPYLITIGMNGVGGACTQYTSEYFSVISYRDGEASEMYYEKGKHVWDELKVYPTDEPNGTFVKWKIDPEVFDDVNIPDKWYEALCRDTAIVTGFTVNYVNERKNVEKAFKGSNLQEDMKELTGVCAFNSMTYHTVDNRGDICVCEAQVAMGRGSDRARFFNNMIEIHGGSHANGLYGAVGQFFLEVGKSKGYRIKEADYSNKLQFSVATLNNKMSMHGQTKDSLDDEYILYTIYQCVYKMLNTEYAKGTSWLVEVVEETLRACEIRVAQEELLKNNREIEKSLKRHKVSEKFMPSKLYREGKSEGNELFIVEGDSAGGRALTARKYLFQCILKIRGKSLNVYKASIEDLLANAEIKDLIGALGCGIDLGVDGYESFDISKLKVDRIYYLADADIDGKHIKMLLFLIFLKLFPELLYQGRVYIVDTPLYIINLKHGDAVYCMDGDELAEKRKEIGENNIRSVDRFKGLGETSAEVLWSTTLDPERRRTHQIKLERNDPEMTDVLEVLFGKSTERRKSAILGSLVNGFEEVMANMKSMEEFINEADLELGLEYEEVELS